MMNRTLPNRTIWRKFWVYYYPFPNSYRKILVNAIKKNVNFPFLMNPNNMVYPGQKVFSACINQFFPIIMEGPPKFLTSLKLNQFVFLSSGAEICKIHRVLRLTTPEKENNTEKKMQRFFYSSIFWLKLKNKTVTVVVFLSQ